MPRAHDRDSLAVLRDGAPVKIQDRRRIGDGVEALRVAKVGRTQLAPLPMSDKFPSQSH